MITPDRNKSLRRTLVGTLLVLAAILLGLMWRKPQTPRQVFAESVARVAAGVPEKFPGAVIRAELTDGERAARQPVNFALKLRNADELEARVRKGEVLSRAELRSKYLPDEAAWSRVADWARREGLEVRPPDNSLMTVFCTGTVAEVERVLAVDFSRVRGTDGGEYTSAVSAPSVPQDLGADIQGILQLQPHLRPTRSQTFPVAPDPGEMVTPADVMRLYDASNLGLDGAGQTIVVLGVYQVNPADIVAFWTACGLPADAGRFTHLAGAVTGGSADEETMDIQWAGAIAPGATVVYLPSIDSEVVAAWVLGRPDSENIHQITSSYGMPEYQAVNVVSPYFLAMAAVGGTVFNASGDFGSATSGRYGIPFRYDPAAAPAPSYPASDPFVTAVGGTAVDFVRAAGQNNLTQEGAWSLASDQSPSEQGGAFASTGGYSPRLARPVWQVAPGLAANGKRAVPDVAALSFSNKGQFVMFNGEARSMGGTSLSAPIWSGLCALINQARANASLPPVGLLGPKLYPLAGTNAFRPITHGSNYVGDGFSATATNGAYTVGGSYNLLTGLGPPIMPNLVAALTMPGAAPTITQDPADQTVVQGGTATFSVGASGDGALTYQWIIDGIPLSDGTLVPRNYPDAFPAPSYSGTAAGAHTDTLTISNAYVAGFVEVEVVVSNGFGTAYSPKRRLTLSQQTFHWSPPAQIEYGIPLSAAQLNAWAAVPGSFLYVPAAGAILEPGVHEITVTFTPQDQEAYPVASFSQRLTVTKAVPVLTWSQPAPMAFGGLLSAAQLNATAGIPGTFVYAPAAGAVLGTGKHTLRATFTPDDLTRYVVKEAEQILTVMAPGAGDWSASYQTGNATGSLTAGGRIDYLVPNGSANDRLAWALGTGMPYAQPWSVEVDVDLQPQTLGPGQFIELGLVIIRTSDLAAPLESVNQLVIAMDQRPESGSAYRGFHLRVAGNSPAERREHAFPDFFGPHAGGKLRVSFNAADSELVASCSSDGTTWKRLGAVHIDGGDFDWGMNVADSFSIMLLATSGSTTGGAGPTVLADAAVFRNFRVPHWQPEVKVISRLRDTPARFSEPRGVAVAANGVVYVSDHFNRAIRRISTEGHVVTLAGANPYGFGKRDGMGRDALFQYLGNIALGPEGDLLVADPFNNQIRRVSPAGMVTTLAGSQNRGFVDGSGENAKFAGPQAVAVSSDGIIYIADTGNNAIRRSSAGGVITTLAGAGTAGLVDGPGATARFNGPQGIAVNGNGEVWVADTLNHCVRRIDASGVVTTVAGSGTAGFSDGSGGAAQFNQPMGLAFAANGFLYVADSGNRRIRQISPAGEVTTVAGTGENGSADGPASAATFGAPAALAFEGAGNLIVADPAYSNLRVIATAGQVTTLAGGNSAGYVDGPATLAFARINSPTGLGFAADGSMLVTNAGDGTLSRISVSGILTDRHGNGALGYPTGLSVAPDGSAYLADRAGHAVKKVGVDGVVTTVAGEGSAAFSDGPAAAAQFNQPGAVLVCDDGSLLVADTANHRIRKQGLDGNVGTLAGSGTAALADGTGADASFNQPKALVAGRTGEVFVADAGNHVVRRVDPMGVVTTLAGDGFVGTSDGTGTGARFDTPVALGMALGGSLYVADAGSRQIRRIKPSNEVVTIGTLPFAPQALAVDQRGTLHVVNQNDNEVLAVVRQTATRITWAPPVTVPYGSDFAAALGTAEADVPGTYAYAFPTEGTGLSPVTVTFTPFNEEEYSPTTATRDVLFTKATQMLVFELPASVSRFASPMHLSAQASSGMPVNFVRISGPAYVEGSELHLYGEGEVQVRAWQAGDSNYESVEKVVTIMVGSETGPQTIAFSLPATMRFSAVPFGLGAIATSGLPVSYEVISGPGLINASTLELTGLGIVTVRATQAGSAAFLPAPPVERTVEVRESYAFWLLGAFAEPDLQLPGRSGPLADPDADGFTNLAEYALGLDPMSAESTGLPEIGLDGSDWVFTYRRPLDRTDLSYVVEVSTDLTNWSSLWVEHQRIESGTTETWEGRYPLVLAPNVYFRLRLVGN